MSAPLRGRSNGRVVRRLAAPRRLSPRNAVLRKQRLDGWMPLHRAAGMPTPIPSDRARTVRASDGVELWVEEVGPENAPLTVFFAHGYTLRHEIWLPQRNALAEKFGDRVRLVFYDHRSHGRSTLSPRGNSTLWQLARDLHSVINACAPTGPVVLIGHSMGGMTIMRLAEQAPELFRRRHDSDPEPRVAGVGFVNTTAGDMHEVALLGFRALRVGGPLVARALRAGARLPNLVERGRTFGSGLADTLAERFAFAAPETDPAALEFCLRLISQTRIEVIHDFFDTLIAHDGRLGLLNLVDQNVLIIAADHDDLTPLHHSHAIKLALPKARLRVFERSGHMTNLEYPGEVNAELTSLIAAAYESLGQ